MGPLAGLIAFSSISPKKEVVLEGAEVTVLAKLL
jgi:hypothetical protein